MLLPEGTYRAFATGSIRWGETRRGKAFVSVDFRIVDGELSGRTAMAQLWMTTDKAVCRAFAILRTAGASFPNDDPQDLEGLGSAEVEIRVEHQNWNGRKYARVVDVIGVPPRRAKAKLRAQMRRAVLATKE